MDRVEQVLSLQREALNSVVCAFSLLSPKEVRRREEVRPCNVISIQFVTRNLLDCGAWPVFQHGTVLAYHALFHLQSHIDQEFVGTEIIGAGIMRNFLDACHGKFPWNGYFDPEFFDKLLIAPDRKPRSVVYVSKGGHSA